MNEISVSINLPTIIFFSSTLLILGVCLFLIGYFVGKQSSAGVCNTVGYTKPTSFFQEQKKDKTVVSIDDTKYVVDIKTSEMEKKYESLGEIKESEEDIISSINKLKNMKR
jgi:hypothetical protein